MSDYAEDRFHRKLDAALGRVGEADDVNALAQAIRVADGNHDLGAGALAEALMPWLAQRIEQAKAEERERIASAIEADWNLRRAARALLNARVAMATGRHRPADEARAWDRFALALDAAEDAAIATREARHA